MTALLHAARTNALFATAGALLNPARSYPLFGPRGGLVDAARPDALAGAAQQNGGEQEAQHPAKVQGVACGVRAFHAFSPSVNSGRRLADLAAAGSDDFG